MFGHACAVFGLLVTFAVVVALVPASARADAGWLAPAGCPDEARARERLRAFGADPALLQTGEATVRIDVAPTGEQRARVWLLHDGRSLQRALYDRSCEAVAEAALLVISLEFDGARAQLVPKQTAARDASAGEPQRERRMHVALVPTLRLESGSLPATSLGLGAALQVRLARVWMELEGAYYAPREDNAGLFGLATAAGRACVPLLDRRRVALAPCAALEVGRARGRATGDDVRRDSAHGAWAAALGGLALAFGPYERFSPSAMLEVGAPFRRPSFDLDGVGPVFQARSVVVRASLRIAFDVH